MNRLQKNSIVRGGFTLVEMIIVIGIIALLAALTLGISSSVMRNSEIHKTEDALKLMTMAFQEWELERGRSMTFEGYVPVTNGMYDVIANGENIAAPLFSEQGVSDEEMRDAMQTRIESTVEVLMQSESALEILSKISPDLSCMTSGTAPNETHTSDLCTVGDVHGRLLLDSWGMPIGIVFPGRNFAEANQDQQQLQVAQDQSGDQSVRDQAEDGLGSCINGRPYFVSAGPDRIFGYRFQSNNQNSYAGAKDPNDPPPFWEDSIDNIYSYEPYLVESAR